MDNIVVANSANIIGRRGENEATRLLFPIAQWIEQYGEGGRFELIAQRQGDAQPYPVAITSDDQYVYWTISAADTAIEGYGTCELYYYRGDVLAKSAIYSTIVFGTMDEPGNAPEPYEAWIEQVQQYSVDAAEAAEAAQAATVHSPQIGENGNWETWNGEEYEDTGVAAQGDAGTAAGFGTVSATVDANVGTPGVEVTTSGPDTALGIAFAFTNLKGAPGQDGTDGVSPEVTITDITDGHRVTITDAEHPSGQSFDVMDGADGQDGTDGQDGASAEITGASASATTLSPGSSATVSVTAGGTSMARTFAFTFGLPKGEKGNDGSSFVVKGIYATLSALQTAHPTGNAGDAYAVGTATSNTIYLWDVDQSAWENVGALKGNGIVSVTKTGTSGLVDTYTIAFSDGSSTTFTVTNGADGQDGTDGQDGAPGAAAGFGTVSATVDGNTGTPGVTVSTSGPDTAKNISFAFTNLKGEQGAAGPNTVSTSTVTNLTGLLKGNGSTVGAAVAGTDYQTPLSAGTDYATPAMIPSAYSSNPAMDGTASPGSSSAWAKGDHVHPTDTSRMPLKTIDSAPDPTHTGNLISSAAVAEGLATKVPVYGKGINLLDNWYFVGGGSQQGGGRFPINQRGQSIYTGAGYTIDRWKITESPTTLTVNSGYITVSASGGVGSIRQTLENFDYSLTYTISMLLRDGTLATASGMCNPNQNITVYINGSPFYLNYVGNLIFDIQNGSSFDIIAVKLELGDTQTIAHQENGVWVLNEIPMYQRELAKCLAYQYLPFANAYGATVYLPATITVMSNGDANNDASALVRLETPVPLRIKPNGYYDLSIDYSMCIVRNYTKNSYLYAKAYRREGYGVGYISFDLFFTYGTISMGDDLVIYGQSGALSNPQCFIVDNNL